MILLNFSHPFTAEQLRQVVELAGRKIDRVLQPVREEARGRWQ